MAKKDVRAQEIQQEETERVSKATVVVPQENTPHNIDSEDKRKIENKMSVYLHNGACHQLLVLLIS